MIRTRAMAALGVAAALGASATAAAASSTSHATLWRAKNGLVACGVEIHPPNKPASRIICAAGQIPAPPHTTSEDGDPGFVDIAKTGKPKLLRTSQDSFVGTNATILKAGAKWSDLGVSCTVSSGSVRCVNASHHGFTIEFSPKSKYSSF